MNLADLRDLVIIAWGVIGIMTLILVMVLTLVVFRKVMNILHMLAKTAAMVQGTANFVVGLRQGLVEILGKL